MGVVDSIKALLRKATKASGYFFLGSTSYSRAWNYETYAREGFRMNPVVFSCIDHITGAAKKINLVLMKDDEVIDNPGSAEKPILDLLNQPNPNESIKDFIERWMLHMNLCGMAFTRAIGAGLTGEGELERSRQGELWLIQPNNITIKHRDKLVTEYLYKGQKKFTPEEMYHWLYPDPLDDFAGMPPLRAAARAADAHNKLYEWNDAIFDNHGVPAGIVSVKGLTSLPEDKIKKLMDEWAEKYGGPKNAGKVGFLAGDGMDYTQLAYNPHELEWLGGEGMLARRICNVFKVPSQILGDPDTSKYSNYKVAVRSLYNEKVIPDMKKFIEGLNKWLMPMFKTGYQIGLDYSHIEVLQDDQNELFTRLNLGSWMTINEKRSESGLDEIDGGDVVYLPFNLVPMGASAPADEPKVLHPLREIKLNGSLYPEQKDRIAAFLRNEERRQIWERRYKTAAATFFNAEKERVLEELQKWAGSFSGPDIERKIDAEQMNLFDEVEEGVRYANEMRPVSAALIIDFGQAALDEIGLDALFEIERPGMEQWLAEELARNGKNISVHTAKEIKRVINAGLAEGEGISKLADRIEDLYSGFSRTRSLTIARTEVGSASGQAKLEGYQQGGVPRKEWLSAFTPTSRDAHMAADGQVVDINDPFSIDGNLTMTAPARTGVPEQDIN